MKKFKLTIIVLLLTAVSLHIGCMSNETPTKGGVSGVVTDSFGNSISGVKISTPEASTLTSIAGKWSIDSLTPQLTEITASREGYQTQRKNIEVISGQTIEKVNFSMAADGDLYDITVSNLTSSKVTISFRTKKQAIAYIKYGISGVHEHTTPKATQETFLHVFQLTDLTPASTYNFICVAEDKDDRVLESVNENFTTSYTVRGEPPQGLKLTKLSGSNIIHLTWNTDAGTDFAGFNLYRSVSPNGPFAKIASMNQNTYSDMEISAGTKYYYYVTRLSGAGDESPPSNTASFLMPGIISANTVWTSQNSPYILTGDLRIMPGVSLVIDKGVSIGVAKEDQWDKEGTNDPIDILVQGTLMIQGTASEPVSFNSISNTPQAGDWNGITFDTTADLNTSVIKSLDLSCGTDGIKGLAGIPEIIDSRIFNCRQSGIQCSSSSRDISISSTEIDTCGSAMLIKDNNVNVKITDCKVLRCIYGIVCRGNNLAEIKNNIIQFSGVTGIDLGNSTAGSITSNNVVGYGSNGSAIVCRGVDEVRRNTLQANIGIEIKSGSHTILRSNLILANDSRNSIGVLYSDSATYVTADHDIQNNVIWDIPTGNSRRYSNSDGTSLPGISSDERLEPSLQGGNPFTELPTTSFNYIPSTGSQLHGAGYNGEDVGAFDVPD